MAFTIYTGAVTQDFYGRTVPKHAHGTISLKRYSSSTREIRKAVLGLLEQIVNPGLFVRRINLTANHVITECEALATAENAAAQMSLFDNTDETEEIKAEKQERRLQTAILNVQKKYGKNAMLKAVDLTKSATARERNAQIGGHKM